MAWLRMIAIVYMVVDFVDASFEDYFQSAQINYRKIESETLASTTNGQHTCNLDTDINYQKLVRDADIPNGYFIIRINFNQEDDEPITENAFENIMSGGENDPNCQFAYSLLHRESITFDGYEPNNQSPDQRFDLLLVDSKKTDIQM